MIQFVTAALAQLGRTVEVLNGGPERGVQLVGSGMIDDFGAEMFFEPSPKVPARSLPLLATDEEAVLRTLQMAEREQIAIAVAMAPNDLTRLVIESAVEMPGYGPHEVGAGFVSVESVTDRLASFTGLDLVAMYGDGTPSAELATELGGVRLFRRGELVDLFGVTVATGPAWRFDRKRATFGMLPKHPGELAELTEEEQRYGEVVNWPPGR